MRQYTTRGESDYKSFESGVSSTGVAALAVENQAQHIKIVQ
jgi:hypothetical protein